MRGKPFEPGNILGKGRPRGSRNQKTKLLESLESHGDAILQQCKFLALKGDRTALRLCVERLLPVAKAPGPRFRLPAIQSTADLKNLLLSIVKQTSKGNLSAYEAEALARVVDSQLRVIATSEFDERIRALEGARSDRLEPQERNP